MSIFSSTPKQKKGRDGQGLVEYALILVLVSVASIVVLAILGPSIGNVFSNVVCSLEATGTDTCFEVAQSTSSGTTSTSGGTTSTSGGTTSTSGGTTSTSGGTTSTSGGTTSTSGGTTSTSGGTTSTSGGTTSTSGGTTSTSGGTTSTSGGTTSTSGGTTSTSGGTTSTSGSVTTGSTGSTTSTTGGGGSPTNTPTPTPTNTPTPTATVDVCATASPPSNFVFRLQNFTGSSVSDMSGNNHNATSTSGRYHIGNHVNINTGSYDQKTFAVEFTTGADTSGKQVIYEQGGGTRGINVYIDGGNLYLGIWNLSPNWGLKNHNIAIQPNTTYYAIIVLNNPNTYFYVDGTSIGSNNDAGTLTAHSGGIGVMGQNSSSKYHSGGNSSGSNFNGSVAEILTWNSAISGTDLSDLHTYLGCP